MKPTFILLTLILCTLLLCFPIVPFGLQHFILVLISLPWTNGVFMKFRISMMSFFNLVVFVLIEM